MNDADRTELNTSRPTTTENGLGLPEKLGVLIALLVVVIFVVFAWAVYAHIGPFPTSQEGGQFGDAFGSLTSLFNALAFVGLLTAMLLQREDLKLQRHELQLQREELEQTREVLNEQSEQLAAQADAAQRQVFEATFFRLFESFREIVGALKAAPQLQGTSAMHQWAIMLRDHDNCAILAKDLTPLAAGKIYAGWYPVRRPHMSSYFDMLRMTMEFIEASRRSDAIFYSDIVRATLSTGELFLIFHHAIGDTGDVRLKALIEKYGLLEVFDPETYDLPAGRRQWYSVRRLSRDYASQIR